MDKIKQVKGELKECGISRVTVKGDRIYLPKRVFSVTLRDQLVDRGWNEEEFYVPYGGFSCDIKLRKDETLINISDYNGNVCVFIK